MTGGSGTGSTGGGVRCEVGEGGCGLVGDGGWDMLRVGLWERGDLWGTGTASTLVRETGQRDTTSLWIH